MNKEIDLSNQWFEAWRLRQWAKGKMADELSKKIEDIEIQMFDETDERIDNYWHELKRGDNFLKNKDST